MGATGGKIFNGGGSRSPYPPLEPLLILLENETTAKRGHWNIKQY